MNAQAAELPKSLQRMIAEVGRAIEKWDDDDDDGDVVAATKEWAIRLSRGEYDEDLYWECVAEDCERAGDFRGAIAAYEKILGLSEQGGVRRTQALSGLARLHELLGDDRRTLKCLRAAVKGEQTDDKTRSGIFLRLCLYAEARHQIRRGRVRAARRLIRRAYASFEEGHHDYLGYAKLQIALAECDVAAGNAAGADDELRPAWEALEQMVEWMKPHDYETGPASGVEAAFADWWSVEARRRRLGSEPSSEAEAWQKALYHRRRGCEGWDNLAWNVAIERTLEKLADACVRNGKAEAAAQARDEAAAIRVRWHLPESIALDQRDASRWSFGRLFRRGR